MSGGRFAFGDLSVEEDADHSVAEVLEEANETEVWDAYKCRSLDNVLRNHPDLTHPGDVCEAASLVCMHLLNV